MSNLVISLWLTLLLSFYMSIWYVVLMDLKDDVAEIIDFLWIFLNLIGLLGLIVAVLRI